MPAPREGAQANVIGGKIYVVGGNSSANDVYDPATDSWSTKTSMPVAPSLFWGWSCASAVVDGKIHVVGANPFSNSHQIYDPETDSWNFGTPLISGYFFATTGVTTGVNAPKRIYVFGADRQWWDNGEIYFTGQSYDLVSGNWTACAPMPTGRVEAAVAVVDTVCT
jgi:N-acetylneuraminic acid mutarotase